MFQTLPLSIQITHIAAITPYENETNGGGGPEFSEKQSWITLLPRFGRSGLSK